MTEPTDKKYEKLLRSYYTYDPEITFYFDADCEKTAPPLPFFVRYKAYLTAAAMVLAAVMSISAIFFFRNKEPVPALPAQPTAATEETEKTEALSLSQSKSETDEPAQETSAPAAESQAPTQSPTQASTSANENTVITVITEITTVEEEPAASEPDSPRHPAEEPPTEKAADQTESPTAPPAVKPVYLYDYYRSPLTVETEPETEPTEGQTDTLSVKVSFSCDVLSQEDSLYCRAYDEKRTPPDSFALFAPEHKADFTLSGNTVTATKTFDIDTAQMKGSYFFEFYDRYGRVLCVFELIPR